MTPNIMRPRSRGTVSLDSPDPDDAPVIDYGCVTSVNTVITVMMLAERASDLIAEDLARR